MSSTVAVVAAAQKYRNDEEEEMANFTKEDLSGWEFKIFRSTTAAFKDSQKLKEALDQEAQTGWSLMERFDERRVRLKRHISEREKDSTRAIDPYRMWYGMTGQQYYFLQAGIIMLITIVLVVLLAIFLP